MDAGRFLKMARIKITYRTGRPADDFSLGAFSQIAAKRRFGLEAMKSEDSEPVFFAAFVELEGPAAAKAEDAFDAWLLGVEDIEILKPDEEKDEDPANPPPAESFDTSPGSPPTSE